MYAEGKCPDGSCVLRCPNGAMATRAFQCCLAARAVIYALAVGGVYFEGKYTSELIYRFVSSMRTRPAPRGFVAPGGWTSELQGGHQWPGRMKMNGGKRMKHHSYSSLCQGQSPSQIPMASSSSQLATTR